MEESYDASYWAYLVSVDIYTNRLKELAKIFNYSVEDTAKLQQLIDSGQFELAEQLQIGLIELYNKTN